MGQTKKRNSLEHALRDYRSRMATEEDVFKALEGDYTSSFENLKEFTSTELKKIDFCKKYIIKVVLDFEQSPINRDLILAIYGLLAGYETIPQTTKRRDAYCDIVGIHDKDDNQDKSYSAYWHKIKPDGTIDKKFYRNITSKEEGAIRRLTKVLRTEINKNNGVLGYIKDADKIAEIAKTTYPEPFYLREEVYRQCAYDGKVFYVPLTEQELVKKAQHINLKEEKAGAVDTARRMQTADLFKQEGGDLLGVDSEDRTDKPETPPLDPTNPPEPPLPPPPAPPPESPRFVRVFDHVKKLFANPKWRIGFSICITGAIILGIGAIYIVSLDERGIGANRGNDYDGPGWGDNGGMRTSHTTNEINAGALGNQIIFNTISDSVMGDEKNFVGARKYTGFNSGENNVWEGNDIVVEDGKEYIIRIYVHNNNRDGYDGIAEDTRVSFSIPRESSKHITVNGFIMSSNATPSEYWDYVTFHGSSAFHLEYQSGSAILENDGIGKGGLLLSDAVVDAASGGSPIGFDSLDGRIPGCYTYDSFITIRVKAIFDIAYTIENQVRLVGGDKTWGNSVDAKIGDVVEFRVAYKNNSDGDQSDVGIRDVLPDGLKYIEGSTLLVNAKYPDGGHVEQDDIVTVGINIGDYLPEWNAFVRFRAEVVDENLAEHGKTALVNWAQGGVGQAVIQDCAKVIVYKE